MENKLSGIIKLMFCCIFILTIILLGNVYKLQAQDAKNPIQSVNGNEHDEQKEYYTQSNLSLLINDSLLFKVDTLNKKFLFKLLKIGNIHPLTEIKAKGKWYNIYYSEKYYVISTFGLTKKYSHKTHLYKIDPIKNKVKKSKHKFKRYLGSNATSFFFLSEKKYFTKSGKEFNYIESISANKETCLHNPLENITVSEGEQPELQLYNENILYYCKKEPKQCYFVNENHAEYTDISNLYYGLYYNYKNHLIVYDENNSTFYAIHQNGIETILQLKDLPELKNCIRYYLSNFRVFKDQIIMTLNVVFPATIKNTEIMLNYSIKNLTTKAHELQQKPEPLQAKKQ